MLKLGAQSCKYPLAINKNPQKPWVYLSVFLLFKGEEEILKTVSIIHHITSDLLQIRVKLLIFLFVFFFNL